MPKPVGIGIGVGLPGIPTEFTNWSRPKLDPVFFRSKTVCKPFKSDRVRSNGVNAVGVPAWRRLGREGSMSIEVVGVPMSGRE